MATRTISHHEVLEKLGEGGMGVVYRARDTQLDRLAALKTLPAGKAADSGRRERFLHEARSASALNHPNIVTIHDIVRDADGDVMVMEFVAGKTLDELIPKRGFRVGEALQYAVQIADALATAHAAGIVHRDLKLANVMVTGAGQVKVLDFGLAKLTEAAAPAEDDLTRTMKPRTQEGQIVGTVGYMSPEQAQGRPVDARSDIFSFGCVLQEMIAGEPPFRGDSNMSALAAIINKDAAPLPESTPHDLAMIVTRCLRKDPNRRFQHMADVKVALEDVKELSESGTLAGAPAAPARRRRQWLLPAAVGAAVLLGAAAAWIFLTRKAEPAGPLVVVPLTSYPGEETMPALSPDGNLVAFSWNGPNRDNSDIYVLQIGGGSPLRLTTNAKGDSAPAWSPDGRLVAFVRTDPREVIVVPALGGPERKVASLTAWGSRPALVWTADGKHVATTNNGKLALISIDTGESRPLTGDSPSGNHTVAAWAGLLVTQQDQLGSDLMLVENFR